MDNKQLIVSDISKKQKSVEAQRRYRLRLKKDGAGKEGTETTYDTYKKSNAVKTFHFLYSNHKCDHYFSHN